METFSCLVSLKVESHLNTQRAAVKMLHDRIAILVQYAKDVIAGTPFHLSLGSGLLTHCRILGQAPKDHAILRSLSALVASLPASENKGFREEFDTVSLNTLFTPSKDGRSPDFCSYCPW